MWYLCGYFMAEQPEMNKWPPYYTGWLRQNPLYCADVYPRPIGTMKQQKELDPAIFFADFFFCHLPSLPLDGLASCICYKWWFPQPHKQRQAGMEFRIMTSISISKHFYLVMPLFDMDILFFFIFVFWK